MFFAEIMYPYYLVDKIILPGAMRNKKNIYLESCKYTVIFIIFQLHLHTFNLSAVDEEVKEFLTDVSISKLIWESKLLIL